MTIQDFDNTGWKAGMQVKVGNVKYHVWRIDFGLKRVQVKVDNRITNDLVWLHCLDFEVVQSEPAALDLIAAEREKQIQKGYTVEHDQKYVQRTGISYSLLADRLLYNGDLPDDWNMDYWIKLRNLPIKRKLAIAGAWIAAEIDRLLHLEIR